MIISCASKDKFLYFFDENGYNGNFDANSFLIGTPSIGNIDEDPELEVIIGGYSGGDGRSIFAINHDLSMVDGFPIFIGEKIKMGVSLADFNQNGKDDMVFGTDSDHIYFKVWGDCLRIVVNSDSLGKNAEAIKNELEKGDPSIWLILRDENTLELHPNTLEDGQENIVAEELRRVLSVV